MIRINILSLKGGVGKSLIAFKLAVKLSRSYKVVLVDRSLSKSISSFLGIREEFRKGEYWKDLGNLRVLRFDYPADESQIIEEYKNLMTYDVMIVDNPSLPSDEFFNLDLTSWVKASNSYTYDSIVILTPPGELMDQTLKVMLSMSDYLKEIIEGNLSSTMTTVQLFRPIGIVINEVKSEYQIDYDKIRRYLGNPMIIKIPFKKKLFGSPFSDELNEIDPLVDYIRTLT